MTPFRDTSPAWDPRVPVEENLSNWKLDPVVRVPEGNAALGGPLMVDLFSGAGGFSVGLHAAGFAPALAVDIHRHALETYAANHPAIATVLGDIRRVQEDALTDAVQGREVSLVAAGVPCQGFSLCNRKRHDDDRRNWLFCEFIRIVRLLKPAAVVLENVSTLRSADSGSFAREIANAIAASGYHVESQILNAADFGVPQLRRRLFFIGVRPGRKIRWPKATHGNDKRAHVSVWEAISDLPALQSGECGCAYATVAKNDYQEKMRLHSSAPHNHTAPRHPPSTVARIARTRPGEPMYPRFRQRIRLDPNAPSPTQVAGGIRPQFSLGHPTQPRGLSIRERCRLQSFPDDFSVTGGIVQGRVQTGNAVPPLLAEAIGKVLIQLI